MLRLIINFNWAVLVSIISISLVFANTGFDEKQPTYLSGNFETFLKKIASAAEQGDVDAQYTLGNMYTNGRGVTKNLIEAL